MPIYGEGEFSFYTHSAIQTRRIGTRLGRILQPGDTIFLSGDLGAGKTIFSSGLGEGWGSAEPLTSPTYSLVHQHRRAADDEVLYHIDCYRLNSADDAETIGFDDIVESSGVVVVEWPERIEQALPDEHLWIDIIVLNRTRRQLIFEPSGSRYIELSRSLRDAIYGVNS